MANPRESSQNQDQTVTDLFDSTIDFCRLPRVVSYPQNNVPPPFTVGCMDIFAAIPVYRYPIATAGEM